MNHKDMKTSAQEPSRRGPSLSSINAVDAAELPLRGYRDHSPRSGAGIEQGQDGNQTPLGDLLAVEAGVANGARDDVTGESLFASLDLFKRYLPIVLPLIVAAHAALILTGALSGSAATGIFEHASVPWASAMSCALLGFMGFSSVLTSPTANGLRAVGVILSVLMLCLATGGPHSQFTAYLFIATAVYSLLLPLRFGLVIPWAAAAAWLSVFIFPAFHANQDTTFIMMGAGALIVLGLLACAIGRGISHYRQLHMLAHTDELTGLSNRRHFRDSVEREMDIVKRDGRPLTLITFDLDNFKYINDEYGHVAGDAVLRHFAEVLRLNTRRNDVVARIGGDEFAVVLPDMTDEAAVDYVQGIQDTLSMEFVSIPGASVQISSSAGVVTVDANGPFGLEEVLKRADDNLYQSKRKQRQTDTDRERRKRSLLLGRSRVAPAFNSGLPSSLSA